MAIESLTYQGVDLPGLTSVNADLVATPLTLSVVMAGADVDKPMLMLEGDDTGFDFSFNNGALRLNDKLTVLDDASPATLPRAFLTVPADYEAGYQLRTWQGDIFIKGITTSRLKIASQTGKITLADVKAKSVDLETMRGDIKLHDTVVGDMGIKSMTGHIMAANVSSPKRITIKTMAGHVDVESSIASQWQIETMSGRINLKAVAGSVIPASMSGKIRIS